MFRIKFPTKRIFRIFPILRTDGMARLAPFCNLFMEVERPSYYERTSILQKVSVCYVVYKLLAVK